MDTTLATGKGLCHGQELGYEEVPLSHQLHKGSVTQMGAQS
jgi:hypothetical protein